MCRVCFNLSFPRGKTTSTIFHWGISLTSWPLSTSISGRGSLEQSLSSGGLCLAMRLPPKEEPRAARTGSERERALPRELKLPSFSRGSPGRCAGLTCGARQSDPRFRNALWRTGASSPAPSPVSKKVGHPQHTPPEGSDPSHTENMCMCFISLRKRLCGRNSLLFNWEKKEMKAV